MWLELPCLFPLQSYAMSEGRVKELTIIALGIGSASNQVAGTLACTCFPDSSLAPAQNPSKFITRKMCVHKCQEQRGRWLASELARNISFSSCHPVLDMLTTPVNTPDWLRIMNGWKGDPHASKQLSLWLIIGIHKPIPIARAPMSRWWNRWLRDLEASPHCSFVWSVPTTSVISPLIITLPVVEFPWEGMGQRLHARGLHCMKILTHQNWLFCGKVIPTYNSGNRSPGC